MLGSWVGLQLFGRPSNDGIGTRKTIMRICGGTDNQAAQFLSIKGGSTKLPLTLIMMQLASTLRGMQLELRLKWRPRELNVEADALANLDTSLFNEALQVKVEWSQLGHKVLDKLAPLLPGFAEVMKLKRSGDKSTVPAMTKRFKLDSKSVR